MPRALILGGTGLVGRAAARRLLAGGWQVDLTGRDPARLPADVAAAGGRFVAADRHDRHALEAAYGGGADLLVDCICFTAADAELVVPLARDASSTVLISSKAVYVDARGNHSNSDEPPRFDGPVGEQQPTLPPGRTNHLSREGYGPNKVAAERVLLDSGAPVSVLRPSKIHGDGARPPRSWHFVKRVRDGRPVVLLAGRGEGVDHPTAAANLASLIEACAARPGRRILNSADPDAPNGLAIARAVAAHFGHAWREIPLGDDAPPHLGRHPWDRRPGIVLDTSAALALGWEPAGDFAATIARELDWLASGLAEIDGGDFEGGFDYAAEDAWLASLGDAPAR
ncbi:MAG TPA: NAD-dependent epimerase/dehydratase family protein [Gaiellaceae bacterium]|nr:NAD-dependent epimerase/dehydratase family protein [Gaiellaceae bacterium]